MQNDVSWGMTVYEKDLSTRFISNSAYHSFKYVLRKYVVMLPAAQNLPNIRPRI